MSKLEQAKEAILERIMDKDVLPNHTKILAEAYGSLIMADVQERMTEWQTKGCECNECRDRLDDEVLQ